MATNDKKRWKWFKLDNDFFNEHQLKALKNRPNGDQYAFIYLELIGNSLNHDGKLRFSDKKPYDTETLACVISEDPDVLQSAMDTLEELELIEILEDKTIYIPNVEKHIGSETGSAERKREYRAKNDNVPQMSPTCPPNVPAKSPRVRDKSKEIRDKSKSIESKGKPTRDEVIKYCQERNNGIDPRHFYDYYQTRDWTLKSGQKIKDWKACVRTWEQREHQKNDMPTYSDKDIPQMDPKEVERLLKERNKN